MTSDNVPGKGHRHGLLDRLDEPADRLSVIATSVCLSETIVTSDHVPSTREGLAGDASNTRKLYHAPAEGQQHRVAV